MTWGIRSDSPKTCAALEVMGGAVGVLEPKTFRIVLKILPLGVLSFPAVVALSPAGAARGRRSMRSIVMSSSDTSHVVSLLF